MVEKKGAGHGLAGDSGKAYSYNALFHFDTSVFVHLPLYSSRYLNLALAHSREVYLIALGGHEARFVLVFQCPAMTHTLLKRSFQRVQRWITAQP